jgi:hypothetical protein
MSAGFPADKRAAVDRVIEARRNLRAVRSDPIPEDILMKILGTAAHASAVGVVQRGPSS